MQGFRLFIVCLLALMVFAPSSALGSDCLICHGAMKGKVESTTKGTVVDVHLDSERFYASKHGLLDCTACHLTYSGPPHTPPAGAVEEDIAGLLPAISSKSRVDPVAQAACSRCHPSVFEDYRKSVHGANIFEKKAADGPLCVDCHGSPHYITSSDDPASPINHANMLHTCGGCHEDEAIIEKYELSAHVIEKYKESFHGKKYLLGHKSVPICDDCHGGHAISKWDAEGSSVAGPGKITTCARCHKGAGKKFAAAPAHKYIGKENPIPYYGQKGLILLLLGTFGFIASHVALDAFSDIKRYLSKKSPKEEDSDE